MSEKDSICKNCVNTVLIKSAGNVHRLCTAVPSALTYMAGMEKCEVYMGSGDDEKSRRSEDINIVEDDE